MSTNKLYQLLFACCLLLSAFCILAFAQGGTGKLPPPRKMPNPPIRNPPLRRNPPPRVPDLRISERRVRDIVILDLAGTITAREGGAVLRNAISRRVRNGEKKILLNLAKVSSIDESEAKEMVSTYTSVEEDGGQLKLCSASSKVRAQLERDPRPGEVDFSQISLVSDTFETEEAALARFR